MPRPLPIDARLERAAQLVLRCRIFYDIWIYLEGPHKPQIIDTMERYYEFVRFDTHAHFVAFIVHIAALFEKRKDTINLWRLTEEMKGTGLISVQDAVEVDALLSRAKSLASKAAILRNNLFAHRSATLSYSEAFEKAEVTPEQLRDMTDMALKIANRLLIVRGLNDHLFNRQPQKDADAMLKALATVHRP
jgi:hypothetical protein